MENILEIHIKNNQFGHGYLLFGDFEVARKAAYDAAKVILLESDENGSLNSHPDFFYQKFELFGVKDSAYIKDKVSLKPFFGERKVFVAEISYFSIEAENSLLKILEEPTPGTHFFLIVPTIESVIPTLRSRLVAVDFSEGYKKEVIEDKQNFCRKFIKALPSIRLELVNKMLKKDFSQDKKRAIDFLNELELTIADKLKSATPSVQQNQIVFSLEEIGRNREFLFDRAPSVKMILEHLALVLPRM
ncbi:MAG: hypothetical protein AAB491_00685, partial [Patescibacteria group bacterium]